MKGFLLRKQIVFDWDNAKMQKEFFSILLLSWLRIFYSQLILPRLVQTVLDLLRRQKVFGDGTYTWEQSLRLDEIKKTQKERGLFIWEVGLWAGCC